MDKIYLFTTSRCPACPAAKEFVKTSGLEDKIEMVTVDQSIDGMALAESFGVAFVPAFVIQLEENNNHELMSFMDFQKRFESNPSLR